MIKSSRNQLGNVKNPYQGTAKKVLCVCSAGLLRSPTMANVLHRAYGYNTRSCGVAVEYALIPISEALVSWADEVVFASSAHWQAVMEEKIFIGKNITILDIPDEYEYNDFALNNLICEQYAKSKSAVV